MWWCRDARKSPRDTGVRFCLRLSFGQYTYYYTDNLTTINTRWTEERRSLTAGSGGLTSSDSNGGSLISNVAGRMELPITRCRLG